MKVNLKVKKLVLVTLLATSNLANAQIPVTDAGSIAQQIIDYANQGLQYATLLQQYNQQLTDYALALQNLAALPGSVRNQVQQRLSIQSSSNLTDFGASYSGGSMLLDPNPATYYTNAESLLKNVNGTVPDTLATFNTTLTSLGLPANSTTPEWQSTFNSRMKYEGLLDDFRANALMRNNAANRSNEANNIATEMSNLPANNTVGAIQLLAAQNSLSYAQAEELLKQQAIANRLTQQQQIDILSSEDVNKNERLKTLQKIQAVNTYPAMPW